MQAYWTLTRRELAAYFVSLTGYSIIAAVVFLLGLSFNHLIEALRDERTSAPVTELFYQTFYFWVILLLTAPVITMRLFAQEKFSGTFETLMTAPVSEAQVVLAKFTGALAFYLATWLPLLAFVFILGRYTHDPAATDPGTLGSAFLGIALFGGLFMALGCFASSLTRNQIIAAMISFAFGVTLFVLGCMAELAPAQTTWWGRLLAWLNAFEHMNDFARGVVDTRPVVLYVSLTVFFLFLTLRVVESRRWK